MDNNLKDFIYNNLFNKSKILDSNKLKESWFDKNGVSEYYDTIINHTHFLPDNSLFANRIYCILNDIQSNPLCSCNNQLGFINFKKGYFKYCSSKCSANSQDVISKRKNTFIEKYGDENSFISVSIQKKRKETMISRYGTDIPIKNDAIKQKIESTNLSRYGTKYGFENKEIQEKIKANNISKYGHYNVNHRLDIFDRLSDKNWLELALELKPVSSLATELECSRSYINKWARYHNLTSRVAIYTEENEIYDFIHSLGITNIQSNVYDIISSSTRRQLDIYLPDHKLAIELNGLYWHKEDKKRHLEKLKLCNDKGIKLLQFWDYQWNFKTDICKSIIKNHLGMNCRVFARKCKIVQLSKNRYQEFVDNNHIHGNAVASIRFGLTYNDELVSVISFSKSRYDKNYDYELVRYANKLGINVVGGFSKLLNHFRKNFSGSILSYCDLMLFTGGMYEKSGFKFIKNTIPGYFYFKGYDIKSRQHFQKHKLKNRFSNYDPNISSEDNIRNNGWYRAYDCGNGVWEI